MIFLIMATKKIGKPTGIDIKEQKMTLPLIHTLNVVSKAEKKALVNIVKNDNKNKAKVKELIAIVKEKGGLDFAIKKMENYRKEALSLLFEFPKK